MLVGKLATFVEQEIRRICEATTWTIGALIKKQLILVVFGYYSA
jgi:hypothetical protein